MWFYQNIRQVWVCGNVLLTYGSSESRKLKSCHCKQVGNSSTPHHCFELVHNYGQGFRYNASFPSGKPNQWILLLKQLYCSWQWLYNDSKPFFLILHYSKQQFMGENGNIYFIYILSLFALHKNNKKHIPNKGWTWFSIFGLVKVPLRSAFHEVF